MSDERTAPNLCTGPRRQSAVVQCGKFTIGADVGAVVKGRKARLRRALVFALVLGLSAAASTARASIIFHDPEYVHGFWLKVGFNSEGRFSVGVSAEALPWTASIEVSPQSTIGLFRLFAGVRTNNRIPIERCDQFVGFSGGLGAAFGPGQQPRLGFRVGVGWRHTPMGNPGSSQLEGGRQWGEGLGYNLSGFSGAGLVHEGVAEVGSFTAPRAYCNND